MSFVDAVKQYQPSMLMKQKVHLISHLTECMEQFGPTSGFNSERYELEKKYIAIVILAFPKCLQV